MEGEIDSDYTEEITCPHCGYVHSDSWEVGENSGNTECDSCKKPFAYERNTSVTYSTTKL
jgi:transcription elongation factor Elf1